MDEQLKAFLDAIPDADEKKAFAGGYDCGINGANTNNCHLSLFARPELMKAWTDGKKAAEKEENHDGQGISC